MVVSRGGMSEAEANLLGEVAGRLGRLVEGFSVDEVRTEPCAATMMWLSHSRSQGFARDARTGSWLAAVGNPTGRAICDAPAEALAGRLLGEYLARGREALTALNAPFAVALFDGRDKTVNVVTDRAGLERMYVGRVGDAHVFSTSSLALAAAMGAHLDPAGVAAYFRTGHVLGERTLFREIRKIGAAAWMTVSGGKAAEQVYWETPRQDEPEAGAGEWALRVAEASREALDEALATSQPTTVELTGGLDSRLNLASAADTGRPFAAWTIDGVNAGDTGTAKRLAGIKGVEHIIVSPLGELRETFEADFRQIHLLRDGETDCLNVIASPSANRQSKGRRMQSVTGVGGELFRGALYRSKALLAGGVSMRRLVEWQLCLGTRYDSTIFEGPYADPRGELVAGAVRPFFEGAEGRDDYWRLDRFYLEGELQGAGGRSMTFNNFFYRQAAPYLSNRMLDLAFVVPARLKRRGLILRGAIERTDAALADVPLATGAPARPMHLGDIAAAIASSARYAKRVVGKAAAKTGLSAGVERQDRRLAEIVDDGVVKMCGAKGLVDRLAGARICRGGALRAFLEKNVEQGLPDKTQVGLLLSMDLTLQYLGNSLRA